MFMSAFNMKLVEEILLIGIIAIICFQATNSADSFKNHPCLRECQVDQPPMTCEYNLTVGWYWVLSKACYNCPFNQTDCMREECVSADGNKRALLTYNKQLPGPKIEVCEGDKIVAWVKNLMVDAATTSVHWHGQHQYYSPYMDGVAFITQCGIDYMHSFKYEFTVNPVGTHWYHSHVGLQIADGLFGPFIVRQPKQTDPNGLFYDEDLSEHIITVSDWKMGPFISQFMYQMNDRFDITDPASGLINGRARNFNVKNDNSSIPDQKTPEAEFEITSGMKYRFRFISAASTCQFQMSIDNHNMTVIANDGIPVKHVLIDTFIITPGERYDVIVHANQPTGSYWMRGIGLGDCYAKSFVYAVIRYKTAPKIDPIGDPTKNREGILLNPIPDHLSRVEYGNSHSTIITADSLQYGVTDTNFTDEVVDAKYYTTMFFSNNDNTMFNNKLLYPVQQLPRKHFHATPVMDNITFHVPPIPILSQPEQIKESWFCNRSSLVDSDRCLEDLCICTHLVRFQLGQMVELIVINEGSMFPAAHHPMHLHGYSFRILAIHNFAKPIKLEQIQKMDNEGKLKRNLINPPLRDTFMLPAKSVAILRFKADNPGYWFFHCHVDGHVVQGKALLIKIGEVSDFPPVPTDFPKCGGYGYAPKPTIVKETITIDTCTSEATHSQISFFMLVLMLLMATVDIPCVAH